MKNNPPESWYVAKIGPKGYKNPFRWTSIRMKSLRKAFYEAKAKADAAAQAKADAAAQAKAPVKENNFELTTTNSPLPFWSGTATSPDFKDVIKNADPTTFTPTLTDAGQEMRYNIFDRRINSFINLNVYLFNAEYSDSDGLKIEIQVNPEFNSQDIAREHAEKYAIVIGRLPKALRRYVTTVWIHDGKQPFGGGNNNLLIHVKQGNEYINNEILEEILFHEACHTSLDGLYANDTNWINSKKKDNTYISTYAKDFPEREDIAESFLAYFAVTYRKHRISLNTSYNIISTIPNRIKFFDSLNLDMSPYIKPL
jgi:hypothetical protein